MTNFVWREQITVNSPSWVERIRSLVWKCAIATLLLMMVGSATRVMDAGLACPDWPLCYGQLVPHQQMNFQVFLEWFHRLDAALIGLSTLILTGVSWWQRRALPTWLPWASSFALLAIVFQGVLGGLTVTELLRFDIVTAHLATAMLFFATLVVMGTMLSPYQGTGAGYPLAWVSGTAATLVYLQSLLGGLVASRWAVHQCLGISQLCAVMNSHMAAVVPTTLVTASLIWLAWRTPALHFGLRQLTKAIATLLILQIALGVATFWFRLQVEPLTVAHHTIGVTLLGTLVAFTVLAIKDRQAVTV
ncbi:COX15/CtaA family protein [Merismopedia glauca]|uniref:Heme A synthase n=1 Tax=Merismopedia glauca CCAP 1448/3 TaxID=1296344 RepID=A0A2T1C392_9CYAN|nr:heme A synthase [Merismopedia glauca]PSB02674.1 heme A synthase [Merismopedia glauca CCAP 1448/3]